jgi:amidase
MFPPLRIHDVTPNADRTSEEVTRAALVRIAADDNRAVLEVNPDALVYAKQSAQRYATGNPLSAYDGIPLLIKDNIDTGDRMQTTAGSSALLSTRASGDAFLVKQLRAAGINPIGKANMSEWANFRSTASSSGYSTRGGQCLNPHDSLRCPSGSSSGSAAAVAAGLVPVALGSETDGSIISPSARCGVVGIKPTVGLVSRSGVIPICASQDTVGTHATCVADAAAVLAIIAGVDPRDQATHALPHGLIESLKQAATKSFSGLRIGYVTADYSGYDERIDARMRSVVALLEARGATIIRDVVIPYVEEVRRNEAEYLVMCYEFKIQLNEYLSTRTPVPGMEAAAVQTLEDVIIFNAAHPNPGFSFGQEILERAQKTSDSDTRRYHEAQQWLRQHAAVGGIDAALQTHQLDAIIVSSGTPAWLIDHTNGDPASISDSTTMAACAGYPLITVPIGLLDGLPIGITVMGTAWSDAVLVQVAAGIERCIERETSHA